MHEETNPISCLGLQWEHSEIGKCKTHNDRNVKEAISQVNKSLGIQWKKEIFPIYPKHHPQLDETRILTDHEINECHKSIGMLQWIQLSLRLDACLAV